MGECCAIKNFVHHEDRKKAKTMKKKIIITNVRHNDKSGRP